MAISNLTYKDYLWLTKEKDGVKGIRLSKDNLPSTLNPIASKTFEHVWSTSKSTAEAKTFIGSGTTGGSKDILDSDIYFGKIKPIGSSYSDNWHIKLRLITECETNTDYRSEHICTLYNAGRRTSYEIFNHIYDKSYRNLHYLLLNHITSTGFSNGFSCLFGISFHDNYTRNMNNSNYKRKFYIEILEQEGCEVSFFDDWVSARNYTPATTSTNYWGITAYDAVTEGLQGTNIETLDHRISDIKSNYVTTNTNQTISGKKTFTSTPTVGGINVSLEGHTHKASEVSGLVTTRDIFCVDLLKDRPTNEINLEGGQVNFDGNLLTMIYGTLAEEGVVGISLGLNNGTSELWFALVNDITDEVAYQSDQSIYDDADTWFKDLNNLSNCHIEVFSCTYEEASNAFGKSDKGYSDYYDITLARENLTYLCTIRLKGDQTAWIVE